MKKILVIGCPNAGKSALFNSLTGKNRKVANYSGITVDYGSAELISNKDHTEKIELIDLPGIYSLCPHTEDEAITVAALTGQIKELEDIHGIIVVIDFMRIESSFIVFNAIKRIWSKSLIIVFNKCDKEKQKQKIIKSSLKQSIGYNSFPFSALNDSPEDLDSFIRQNASQDIIKNEFPLELSYRAEQEFDYIFKKANTNARIRIVDEKRVHELIREDKVRSKEISSKVNKNKNCQSFAHTLAVDKILLHPIWGLIIFILTFYFIFLAIYSWSGPFMDFIDYGITSLSEYIRMTLPEGLFSSFIIDGVIAGVGASLVFLPQIFILFFLLAILNQSGYISRASILMDKIMSLFGLNGKAFLPFLSAFACSVPAIMSTRTIKDKTERMATLMVLPMITCSARLPVYVLLVGTFISPTKIFGIINKQALSFFFLYFLGTITALIFAKIFRLSFFKGNSSSFVLELTNYQRPSIKVAFKDGFAQSKLFMKKVATVILFFSMGIWLLSTYPKTDPKNFIGKSKEQQFAISLERSSIGQLGKLIEPLIKPLGYDWRIGVGLLSAFGARELFVSTMGTIYALGEVDEESTTLRERIHSAKDPKTGLPIFNIAVAWSLLIFFAYACQCMSTLAIVKRETKGWKYPFLMLGYMMVLAYGGAFITYHILI